MYHLGFIRPFTDKKLSDQPEDLQIFYNDYKKSEKAQKLVKYFEEKFGIGYYNKNSCWPTFSETLTKEENPKPHFLMSEKTFEEAKKSPDHVG